MNLNITLSKRAFIALEEAARRNQLTPEAIASEVVEQSGIQYATIYKIGVITSAAFVLRIYAAEYSAILSAAAQDSEVEKIVHDLLQSAYVVLDNPRLIAGINLLVSKGLLAPERVAELLHFELPQEPPPPPPVVEPEPSIIEDTEFRVEPEGV